MWSCRVKAFSDRCATLQFSGWKSFKQLVNPRYKVTGKKHFSVIAIPNQYNEAVTNLQKILQNKEAISMHQYYLLLLDFTGRPLLSDIHNAFHWFRLEFGVSLLKLLLFWGESHSKKYTNYDQEKIGRMRTSYSIVSCTTDNSPNIVNAVHLLGITRIPCFVYTINIEVNSCIAISLI